MGKWGLKSDPVGLISDHTGFHKTHMQGKTGNTSIYNIYSLYSIRMHAVSTKQGPGMWPGKITHLCYIPQLITNVN
jgi:hypothetical protein